MSDDEFAARLERNLVEQKPILDLLAQPEPGPCPWCGSPSAVGTCPKSITCPTCGAEPGHSCKRPSGHRAERLHSKRIDRAEAT